MTDSMERPLHNSWNLGSNKGKILFDILEVCLLRLFWKDGKNLDCTSVVILTLESKIDKYSHNRENNIKARISTNR